MMRFHIRRWLVCLFTLVTIAAGQASAADSRDQAENLVPNPQFRPGKDGLPEGWTIWSARKDKTPQTSVVSHSDGNALSIRSSEFDQYAKWTATVSNIQPGAWYSFDVAYQATNVASADVSVPVMLTWAQYVGNGESREVQRDYVDPAPSSSSWSRRARTIQAPEGATQVRVELGLRWTDGGSVNWREPRLIRTEGPQARRVRLATTYLKPNWGGDVSLKANTQMMADVLDKVGPEKPDLVLLSETFTTRGVNRPLSETAETIPGPLTKMLSEKARKYSTYVVTSLFENDQGRYHNTAVLIDRQGRIAGRYRKVHLPMNEADLGVVPGSEYPVFDTDFGRIGIVICWDNWFVEPARALRLKGAEILLWPLIGDPEASHWDNVIRARAMDNGVFHVTSASGGQSTSCIVNPAGEVLGESRTSPSYVLKEVDLNQERRVSGLSASSRGEGKSLFINERRTDTYSSIIADRPDR